MRLAALLNIVQTGRKTAFKTFADHDIEMGRTVIMKLLPPNFQESFYQLDFEVYQAWQG